LVVVVVVVLLVVVVLFLLQLLLTVAVGGAVGVGSAFIGVVVSFVSVFQLGLANHHFIWVICDAFLYRRAKLRALLC
jgi:hypothetical protein